MTYVNRGNAKSELGDHQGAREDCNKAIKIDPNYAPAYVVRGHAKLNIHNYRGAIQDCSKAVSLEPNNRIAYDCRGNAERLLGDYEGAIGDYDTAIKLDSNYLSAINNRGYTRYISGDIAGAIRDYKRIIKIKQHNKGSSNKEMLETILQYLQSHSQQMTYSAENMSPIANAIREPAQGISPIHKNIQLSSLSQKNAKQPWNGTMQDLADLAVKLFGEKQFAFKTDACKHICKIYTFKGRNVNNNSLYQLTKGRKLE